MDESVEHEQEDTIEQSSEPVLEKNDDDEDEEQDEETKTPIEEDEPVIGVKDKDNQEVTTRLKFNDFDSVLDEMDSIGGV
jgi:hypothetical protein